MQLSGNTILITGGTSGIGRSFAEHFYEKGNTVIVCGRRQERLDELKAKYPDMVTRVCDVSNAADRRALAKWVTEHYPNLNVLLNNAGVQLLTDLTHEVALDKINEELETNLVAPMHLCSLLAGHLDQQKDAVIINVSSGLAFTPIAAMAVYCASKAAVHSFTLSLRHQLKGKVKVIEIIPPSVDTELGHERRADKTQSHGGIPIEDFMIEAMQALEDDILEAPIAQSKNFHAKREELFDMINERFGG